MVTWNTKAVPGKVELSSKDNGSINVSVLFAELLMLNTDDKGCSCITYDVGDLP